MKTFMERYGPRVYTLLELAILIAWTLWLTRPFLNLDPNTLPAGREFSWSIESHYAWDMLRECGACAFWNGNFHGGHPTLADPLSSTLHPLVMLTTLGWGVLNGGKLAFVGTFLLAGLSQWALGVVLEVGRLPRVFAAMLAVIAGHLAARIDLGAFGLVISTATFSLVLAAFMQLHKHPGARNAILLGLALAMLAVGGQGYIQAGAAISFFVAVIALRVYFARSDLSAFFKHLWLAVLLAVLLAAPFILPFLHFLPNFGKVLDPEFGASQPLAFVPLNLVINDFAFFQTETLGKAAFPAHYILFVGWLPALLAVYGLMHDGQPRRRQQVFLLATLIFAAFWAGSGEFSRLIIRLSPFQIIDDVIAGLRFTAFFAGVAVAPLLGLTALGLDRFLQIDAPQIGLALTRRDEQYTHRSIPITWLALPLLALALRGAYQMNARFIVTTTPGPEIGRVVDALKTADTQWVAVPFGEHFWLAPALNRGLKIAVDFARTWSWPGRDAPTPFLEASRDETRPGMEHTGSQDGVNLFASATGAAYAVIEHADGTFTPCTATARWGDISITCTTSEAGTLTVQEYSWTGWRASINGEKTLLQDAPWLWVDLPAGNNTIEFRYRPWDVPLGLIVMALGLSLSIWLWIKNPAHEKPGDSHLQTAQDGYFEAR